VEERKMKNKISFSKRKVVIVSILTFMSICLPSTAGAIVNGSEMINLLDEKNKASSIQNDFLFVSNFFDEVIKNINTPLKDMSSDLEKYVVSNNGDKISLNSLDFCFKLMEKKFGEEFTCIFISLLLESLKKTDSLDMEIADLYLLLNEKMNNLYKESDSTYTEILEIIDGNKNFNELSDSSLNLIKLVDIPVNNNYDLFEQYWEEYGRAKGYWHGFYPRGPGFDPTPKINLRNLLWYSDNFYNWFYNATGYLYGLDGWQLRDFEGWNIALGSLFTLCMIFVIISFIIGTVVDQSYFLLAVFPGLLAPALGLLLLVYDYIALTHFLFGTNSFLRLLSIDFQEDDGFWRSGEVNIVVKVVNENQTPIPRCTIYANNTNVLEMNSVPTEWGNWVNELDIPIWRHEEFEYTLGEEPRINDDVLYSLFNRKLPKYQKAVPPPGSYSIYIIPPEGYQKGLVQGYIPLVETGDTLFINVTISEDNLPRIT
jgi:hypothetical protein